MQVSHEALVLNIHGKCWGVTGRAATASLPGSSSGPPLHLNAQSRQMLARLSCHLASAQAFEFKTEFKTTFRATPSRCGTFADRPRIKELPESLNVPKAPTLLTRWGSAVRVC